MPVKHPELNLEGIDEDILQRYISTTAYRLKKIDEAAQRNSMEAVQRVAHNVRGASAFLGFEVMEKLLHELDQAPAPGSAKKASRIILAIKEEFASIKRQIASRYPS